MDGPLWVVDPKVSGWDSWSGYIISQQNYLAGSAALTSLNSVWISCKVENLLTIAEDMPIVDLKQQKLYELIFPRQILFEIDLILWAEVFQ